MYILYLYAEYIYIYICSYTVAYTYLYIYICAISDSIDLCESFCAALHPSVLTFVGPFVKRFQGSICLTFSWRLPFQPERLFMFHISALRRRLRVVQLWQPLGRFFCVWDAYGTVCLALLADSDCCCFCFCLLPPEGQPIKPDKEIHSDSLSH